MISAALALQQASHKSGFHSHWTQNVENRSSGLSKLKIRMNDAQKLAEPSACRNANPKIKS